MSLYKTTAMDRINNGPWLWLYSKMRREEERLYDC